MIQIKFKAPKTSIDCNHFPFNELSVSVIREFKEISFKIFEFELTKIIIKCNYLFNFANL